MRAILLAAGRGQRLRQAEDQQLPKCLLQFDGKSLLERHLLLLQEAGVSEVVLAVGFRYEMIEAELDWLGWRPRPTIVLNEGYELGSMLTVHCVAEALTLGGEILLMDADVLYDQRVVRALTAQDGSADRLLIDREFEAGEEPVKVCMRDGQVVEFRKRLASDLKYDYAGECIGFFRYGESGARELRARVAGYIQDGRADLPHEEAIRDQLLERQTIVAVRDVTGAPWLEIDFAEDIARATREVLPRLLPLP